MNLLTNSSLKCYRRCPRLYRLRYEQGYRAAVEAQALRFGSLIHVGLEAWYVSGGDLEMSLRALDGEADPFDLVRAQIMIEGYHHRWQADPQKFAAS